MYFDLFLDLTHVQTNDIELELFFLKPAPNRRYVMDDLSEFKKNNCFEAMFGEAEEDYFKNNNKIIPCKMINTPVFSKCFDCHSERYYICYIQINNRHDIFGLINKETETYIFLGQSGGHEFLCTNEFCFNATEATPNIRTNIIQETTTGKMILLYMQFYLREFQLKFISNKNNK